MTDKEIIIDGIQIRGCGHYWNGTCHAYTDNTGKFLLCVNSPHCYFKQLKAKEQECEELKKEINGYKTIIEKIRQEVQEDVTCESRECGCDSYEECIECLKNTILNIIDE